MSCSNCSPNFPSNTTGCNGCQGCSQKCHEVVDTVAEVPQFRNAFVTVREENATYHVDEVGNVITVSRNPIFDEEYSPQQGDFKNNIVFNLAADEFYVFDPDGNFKTGSLS